MKRILWVLLTVLMLAGLCCMSIAAADITKHVVGTHGQSGTVADGAEEVPAGASTSGDVVLTVGKINSRYAVDVTFPENMTIAAGDVTWNVNTLQYELDSDALEGQTFKIVITNYSDQPVVATPSAAVTENGTTAGISLTVPDASTTLMAVTDENNPSGEAVTGEITAALSSGDWTASVYGLIAAGNTGDVTVGTVTITIAKP